MDKPIITPELRQAIRAEIFKQPSPQEVTAEMISLFQGKSKRMTAISRRYFFEERTKANWYNGKPFHLLLESDDDFDFIFEGAWRYQAKLYNPADPIKSLANIMQAYSRLYRPYATPSMFSLSRAKEIYSKYNINGKVFDYSCGWGNRLAAALSLGLDYHGVDTNPALVGKLREMAADFKEVTHTPSNVEIRNQPSELLIPDYINRFGLCFSSPPYYDAECYIGDQSASNIGSYRDWLDSYLEPSISNCCKYLIAGGYFVCNIKNMRYRNLSMYDDAYRICESLGLQYITSEPYKVAKRTGASNQKARAADHADEEMMVFRKV